MDKTMIERVADAVLHNLLDRRGIKQELQQIEAGDPEIWQEIREAIGHVAVAAMREPTETMIDAGDALMPHARGTETHAIAGGKVPEDYWRAMIDAAIAKATGQ